MSRTSPSGLGRDAAYALLAVGLEKVVALGIALYLPRHLPLADYGRYVFVISYLGLFQGLPDVALDAVLVTRLARSEASAGSLAGRGAALRLATSLTGAGVALALLAVTARDPELLVAGAIAAGGLLATAANPYRPLLRARLAMVRYLALVAGQAAVAVALFAVIVLVGGGLMAVLSAVTVAAVSGVVLGHALAGRQGARLAPDPTLGRALLAEAWPVAGSALAMAGGQQALQLLLLRWHGPAEFALLGGAQKLIEAVSLVPQAVVLSLLPALAASGAAEPGRAARDAREAARLLSVRLLPAAAALAVWAGPVLSVVLGPAFVSASPVLRILACAVLLNATGVVLTNLLVALGLQRRLFFASSTAALGAALLGAVIIPSSGSGGAAAALVAGMLTGQLCLLALPVTRAHVRPVLAAVLPALAIGAVAAGGVAMLGTGPALGAAIFVVAFTAALVLTGTVRRADLARWGA